MQWHTQVDNITTNLKVKIDFTSPELSATKTVIMNCHVYDSAKGRYDIILGRYLLIALLFYPDNLNISLKQTMNH